MLAHELLTALADAIDARRCIVVTSETSGNPALAGLSLGRFETLVSLQYAGTLDGSPSLYPAMKDVARQAGRLGQFDVGFLDPFHTYDLSVAALRQFGTCTDKRGWLIVHDCYPPYELTGDSVYDGRWSGATYAAFRDIAKNSDRAWFVVDDDYGLGVLGPRKTAHLIRNEAPHELEARWGKSDVSAKRELFREHGPELMRLVSPERVEELLARLLRGAPVEL